MDKISDLVGYSYGTACQLEKIYKYQPDLLHKVDSGELNYTEALAMLPKLRPSANRADNTSMVSVESITITDSDGMAEQTSVAPGDRPQAAVPEVAENFNSQYVKNTGCQADAQPSVVPTPASTPTFAGANSMKACENIAGITITYASGKTLTLTMSDNKATVNVNGQQLPAMTYLGGNYHERDNTAFHVISSDKGTSNIVLTLTNIPGLAA